MTKQEFIDYIKSLTVLELADLVHAVEEEFGVSAQATAVAVAGPAAAADTEPGGLSRFSKTPPLGRDKTSLSP